MYVCMYAYTRSCYVEGKKSCALPVTAWSGTAGFRVSPGATQGARPDPLGPAQTSRVLSRTGPPQIPQGGAQPPNSTTLE